MLARQVQQRQRKDTTHTPPYKRSVRNVRGVQPTQGAQTRQRRTTHTPIRDLYTMLAKQGVQPRQPNPL